MAHICMQCNTVSPMNFITILSLFAITNFKYYFIRYKVRFNEQNTCL